MAKDDSSGGFLSKVVKFVRHPTTSWADLDTRQADRESEYSKAALKEMIERKRRNDFVRKREFDMLRKIRSREGTPAEAQGMRPSFFQSSLPSKPDDRAMTLKKIDEIEAQMSMQWWKTKAARALLGLVTLWTDQDVELRFTGGARLRDLLKGMTPSGRRDVEQLWWELRMAVLRLMNRVDEFELTALDFCVTYELSPPGWERPRCRYQSIRSEGDDGLQSVLGESVMEADRKSVV